MVVEETGQAHDSNPVKLIVSCIKNLKSFANFDAALVEPESNKRMTSPPALASDHSNQPSIQEFGLNLGYTINLNLLATSYPAVFHAIFKSLKQNL